MVEPAELKRWLALRDETPRHEFKLKYVLKGPGGGKHQDEFAKDVMALANTAGRARDDYAYLIIGAGDKLRPDGTREADDVRPHSYSRESILGTVNARCYPSLPDLSYEQVLVDGNYYGVVTVPPSPYMHLLSRNLDATSGSWKKEMVPIRRGDDVVPASFEEMKLLELQKAGWARPEAPPLEQLEEHLTDPAKLAKVRGLVIKEARKLYAALNDEELLKKDGDQQDAAVVERMEEYEKLTMPFLRLFAAGCHGGPEWLQGLWPEALTIVANPTERPGGADALLRRTQVRSYGPTPSVTFGLAQGRVLDSYYGKHLGERRHKMPFNAHVINVLREPLDLYVHSDDNYMETSVRFEYLFALFSESENNGLIPGSFTWESEQNRGLRRYPPANVWIVRDTEEELDRVGAAWPPLKSGLFDGPVERFRAFKSEADEKVARAATYFLYGM